MRRVVAWLTGSVILGASWLVACGDEEASDDGGSGGEATGGENTGGAGASGATPTGGSVPLGGALTGGAPTGGALTGGALTGGALPTGGALTGGALPTGGTQPTGGALPTGGLSGSGGAPTGGAPLTGGAPTTGGALTGGATTGGAPPTGGAPVTGGAPPTGGSTGCPVELEGWATVSGDGVGTTTGGGDAAPVRPTSAQQLMDYASDSTPRVIEIDGTFDVPRLQVNSNKTLVGVGSGATINGGLRIRGSSSSYVSNVIVRNLTVNGTNSDVDGDGMHIYYAHHVWIDHCEFFDAPDGNLDIVHGSNWVTVSWTIFRYTNNPPDDNHRFSNLVGHSDSNGSEDTGRLNVTFHHNWWSDRVHERMPRVRFGQIHSYNNYFSASGNNYCIRAGSQAHILSEGNYFHGVDSPHEFNNSSDQGTAHITERNNVYDNTTGANETGGGGTPFTNAPYSFTLDDANGVRDLVMSCAGPQ